MVSVSARFLVVNHPFSLPAYSRLLSMGGSAFRSLLGQSAFPRLPPAVYHALKERLLPRISELYTYVSVPKEAPEKEDYGDLDFIVAEPKYQLSNSTEVAGVPEGDTGGSGGLSGAHALVQQVLRAKHVIPFDGNRTSNYAVPVQLGEWEAFGFGQVEMEHRSGAPKSEIFYQVDVHVCTDKEEWSRIDFFHSYGDLGMMLGLLARNIGLRLGETGLKLPIPGQPPVVLSTSFDEILPFLGLSRDIYDSGFNSKEDIFRWVASHRFFNPRVFRYSGPGITKVHPDRKMYAAFVQWVERQQRLGTSGINPDNNDNNEGSSAPVAGREEVNTHVREEALIYFDKKSELEARVASQANRERVRKTFCGHNVRDWMGLGDYWKGVKIVMDEVRKRMGGEDGVLAFIDEIQAQGKPGEVDERLREIVIKVRDELGIARPGQPQAFQGVALLGKDCTSREEGVSP